MREGRPVSGATNENESFLKSYRNKVQEKMYETVNDTTAP